MKCALICVGSELLQGKVNTHASTLARRLASVGLRLDFETTVGDDRRHLTDAILRAVHQAEIVLVTGGLGPTFDDLTREAASDATGRRLILDPTLARSIRVKFQRARFRMPATNLRQAYV